MNDAAGLRRFVIEEATRPVLPDYVRLHHDQARDRWVILVPERVLVPDETAVEIVRLCDGRRSVGDIIDMLAERYLADRMVIATDVIAMLQDLADKSFLAEANGETP
jgi:pyrroloquinoline quinone biosynthesis protein D